MFVVVSYDIVDNKKRTKLADLLKDYGTRVQYSVFECVLDKKLFEQMVKESLKYVNLEEDSLRIYYLCEKCITGIEVYGIGKVSEEEDVIII